MSTLVVAQLTSMAATTNTAREGNKINRLHVGGIKCFVWSVWSETVLRQA
ncbi:hypothetical protein COMA1_40458 [Candidatus Nitrospira nitrosa]|uniref:Uncharacterized protein n=1 Tax=Candidatus Nitrospira nitrosa TaxID=1742972 RepID=A0A0S4LNL0_9BACT|nr:hypothetical protein COMA1_40458 [Candidatus Nitrospira nitrosa]